MISELISSDSQFIVVAVSDESETWLEWWLVTSDGSVYRCAALDSHLTVVAHSGDMDDIPF